MPKTLITDLDRDTSPYNPNRPSYFSMQTENNPSKRDSKAFEKAQSVITKGLQTSYTTFIKKIHSQTGITQRKEQANLNLKNPYFQAYSRLSISATHEWIAIVQYSNPRMQESIHDYSEEQLANR